MEDQIYLLLGSNLGNPVDNIKRAFSEIQSSAGTVTRASSYYRTAPWGITNQPDFYNQVIQLSSALSPASLLSVTQRIEANLGRIREIKWGPRVIDIDLLFYGGQVLNTKYLMIPHPGIPERRFTLAPMSEISPDFIHPVLNKTIETLLAECDDGSSVEKVIATR